MTTKKARVSTQALKPNPDPPGVKEQPDTGAGPGLLASKQPETVPESTLQNLETLGHAVTLAYKLSIPVDEFLTICLNIADAFDAEGLSQ